jgi:hypothetical protein
MQNFQGGVDPGEGDMEECHHGWTLKGILWAALPSPVLDCQSTQLLTLFRERKNSTARST